MEALIQKLNSLNTATSEAVSIFKDLFFKTEYNKGAFLEKGLHPVSPMLHYISEGMARGTVNYNGSVQLLWIMETGFLPAKNGFLSGNDFTGTVQFLKESVVYSLDISRAEQLAENNIDMYKMLLEICEERIFEGRKRELMLRLKTPGERLDYIRETYGNLFSSADAKTMSSFLKINPGQFRRLKHGK